MKLTAWTMAKEEAKKRERGRENGRGRVTCREAEREQMPMNHIGHTTLSLSHSRVGVTVRVESRQSRVGAGVAVGSQSRQHTLAEQRPAGDTLGLLTLAYMGAQCRCQCRWRCRCLLDCSSRQGWQGKRGEYHDSSLSKASKHTMLEQY